mgnify:FL=1
MKRQETLNLLGLAMRARKVILGPDFVLKQIQEPNSLVFLASDCGENIRKKVASKATTHKRTVITEFTTDELSAAIGKQNRNLMMVQDKGFVEKFIEYMNS